MRKLKLARQFIEAQGGFVSTQPKEEFTCLVCETRFEDVTKENKFGIVIPAHGCPKCAAQQNAHLTPETQPQSQAVVNASALEQSDGDTPPAQAQVA